MDKSYTFDRDLLQSHIRAWKRQQRREGRPASERELARQVGVTHTTVQNYRKGWNSRGGKVSRMNYDTGLAFSTALNIPLELLMPSVLVARTSDRTAA